MICSGDAGVYGMSGLIYEISRDYPGIEIEIVSGVTAALSGGAVLGAPLMHDFAVISLSDLMTPWDVDREASWQLQQVPIWLSACIIRPAKSAGIILIRPVGLSCSLLLPATVCGIVRQIGRDGEFFQVMTLQELSNYEADMFTTVFIGNSTTKVINGKMVTPRGYKLSE